MLDEVSKPAHYQGDGIECMEAMKSMMAPVYNMPPAVSYWWGCAFKYLWRWPLKNGKQDLEKARQCIDYLIDAAFERVTKEPEMLHEETSEEMDAEREAEQDCTECIEAYMFAKRVQEVAARGEDLYLFGKHYISVDDDDDDIVAWFIDQLVNGIETREDEDEGTENAR